MKVYKLLNGLHYNYWNNLKQKNHHINISKICWLLLYHTFICLTNILLSGGSRYSLCSRNEQSSNSGAVKVSSETHLILCDRFKQLQSVMNLASFNWSLNIWFFLCLLFWRENDPMKSIVSFLNVIIYQAWRHSWCRRCTLGSVCASLGDRAIPATRGQDYLHQRVQYCQDEPSQCQVTCL